MFLHGFYNHASYVVTSADTYTEDWEECWILIGRLSGEGEGIICYSLIIDFLLFVADISVKISRVKVQSSYVAELSCGWGGCSCFLFVWFGDFFVCLWAPYEHVRKAKLFEQLTSSAWEDKFREVWRNN